MSTAEANTPLAPLLKWCWCSTCEGAVLVPPEQAVCPRCSKDLPEPRAVYRLDDLPPKLGLVG